MIKYLSGHYVRSQLVFCQTWASFLSALSDDRLLLFATLQTDSGMLYTLFMLQ